MRTPRLAPWALALSACALATGCSALDFELEEPIEEVILLGDPVAAHRGDTLPKDVVPPQRWRWQHPQSRPAGVYIRSLTLATTATVHRSAAAKPPFHFVRSIVFAIRPTTPGSALPEAPIAWRHLPAAGAEVDLEVNEGLNLVPYVVEGFEVVTVIDGVVPAEDVSFAGVARLHVDVL